MTSLPVKTAFLLVTAALLVGCGADVRPVTLTVETTPPGARVQLDGRFIGLTPILERVTAIGTHRMDINARGYFAHGADLDIKGPVHYAAVLLPTTGTLRLTVWPPANRLFVDGIPTEKFETLSLTTGTHELAVDGGWMGFHRRKISVSEDQELALRWDLTRPNPFGELRLESEPTGVVVLFDGLPWGRTPLTLPVLDARKPYSLLLKGEDGQESQVTVQVIPRERKLLKVAMGQYTASLLHVMGLPKSANLSLTGPLPGRQLRVKSVPESGILAVARGKYAMSAEVPGHYPHRAVGESGSNAPPVLFDLVRRKRLVPMGEVQAAPDPLQRVRSIAWGKGRLWVVDGDKVQSFAGGQWQEETAGNAPSEIVAYGETVLPTSTPPAAGVSGQGWGIAGTNLYAVTTNGLHVQRSIFPIPVPPVLDVWNLPWPKGPPPRFEQGAATKGSYVAVAPASRGILWMETGENARSNVPGFRRVDGLNHPGGVTTDGRFFYFSDRETGRIVVMDEGGLQVDSWQTGIPGIGILAYGNGRIYALWGKNKVLNFKLEDIP